MFERSDHEMLNGFNYPSKQITAVKLCNNLWMDQQSGQYNKGLFLGPDTILGKPV